MFILDETRPLINPMRANSANIYWNNLYTSACTLGSPFPGVTCTTTYDPNLDALIYGEGNLLASIFEVNPAILIIDDWQSPNAFAYWGMTASGFYGTIYLGIRLLRDELFSMDKGFLAVVGIMAHEFAHILQWRNQSRLVGKYRELHADFLAGYYFGFKNCIPHRELCAFARSLFEKGDYNFWNPDHHGTPQERVDAMMMGYSSGKLEVPINQAYMKGDEMVCGF
ncbi:MULTISPECIES: hypothetical protein [unclassified Coleofasciculus]|uniref:hypothetical protein n=1 Tax=unclassified Coleofasciculus TaxID=2692782 RepID=UPI00187F83E2|nr:MULTISPECIES: hypothetical protein [unclassified Coleofasciculus]MBE9127421.1 hypothetical protein [Coleofasciculus sp. LEGE 07081]MBE9149252.1 hypothetical protein [Coleofasciculus sp. LEGE 07092]